MSTMPVQKYLASSCIGDKSLERLASRLILDLLETAVKSTTRRNVNIVAHRLGTVKEALKTAVERLLVTTKECEVRETSCDLLSHSHVGLKHELFDEPVSIVGGVDAGIGGQSILVELEAELDIVNAESTGVESASTHLLSELMQDKNVFSDLARLVLLDLLLGSSPPSITFCASI